MLQVLHDSPGRLDSLWLAHISTLSSSCLGFCAPGCAQTACSHLLLLSSGAQLYCQTNSRPGQQDILPGLLSRYWQISCHVTGDQLQTWYGEALGRGVWGHAPSEKFGKLKPLRRDFRNSDSCKRLSIYLLNRCFSLKALLSYPFLNLPCLTLNYIWDRNSSCYEE